MNVDVRMGLAVCRTCALPVRVTFDSDGRMLRVVAVCGHVNTDPEGGDDDD